MLTASRDAIRQALRDIFPASEVRYIHLSGMPAGFERPALYLHMIPLQPSRLSADMHGYALRWQIVFFPTLDAVGNAVYSSLHDAAQRLVAGLERADTLTAPSGEVFDVTDFTLTNEEDTINCTIALRAAVVRDTQAPVNMGAAEVHIAVSDGKEG